jgi:hypothetical protein
VTQRGTVFGVAEHISISVRWRYQPDDLATATIEHFDQHPDAKIITSLPRLGSLTGARVLAEIGDDRSASPTPDHSRPTPEAHP